MIKHLNTVQFFALIFIFFTSSLSFIHCLSSSTPNINVLSLSIPFSGATQQCPESSCSDDSNSSMWVSNYACLAVVGTSYSGHIERYGTFPVSLGTTNCTDQLEIPFSFQDPNPYPQDYLVTGFSMSLQGRMLSSRPKYALLYFQMAYEVQFGTYIYLGYSDLELASDLTELCPNCIQTYDFQLLKPAKSATLYNVGQRNNFLLLIQNRDVPPQAVYVLRSKITFDGPVQPESLDPQQRSSLSERSLEAVSNSPLLEKTRQFLEAHHLANYVNPYLLQKGYRDDPTSFAPPSCANNPSYESSRSLSSKSSSKSSSLSLKSFLKSSSSSSSPTPRGIYDEDNSLYCISTINVSLAVERFPHSQTTSTLIIILATFLAATCLCLLLILALWYLQARLRARQASSDGLSPGALSVQGDADAVPLLQGVHRMDVVNFRDIEIFQKIGRGSFGDVFRASWAGTIVALKVLPQALHFSPEILLEFKREITLMTTLRHPNIVQFLAANTMPPDVFVILEYMARGSLANILHDDAIPLPIDLRCKLLLDAARGMHYLHSSLPPIIHRDLKSANLLVDDTWRLKVADFGLARMFSKGGESMSLVGSASWTAPELLNHQHATEKVDIYSFAIVVWECLTRQVPHADLTSFQILIQVSQNGMRPPIPQQGHPRIVRLMQRCWADDPIERPTFKYIMKQLSSILGTFPASKQTFPEFSSRFDTLSPSPALPGFSGSGSLSSSLSSAALQRQLQGNKAASGDFTSMMMSPLMLSQVNSPALPTSPLLSPTHPSASSPSNSSSSSTSLLSLISSTSSPTKK